MENAHGSGLYPRVYVLRSGFEFRLFFRHCFGSRFDFRLVRFGFGLSPAMSPHNIELSFNRSDRPNLQSEVGDHSLTATATEVQIR